jgi:hypothetical protein
MRCDRTYQLMLKDEPELKRKEAQFHENMDDAILNRITAILVEADKEAIFKKLDEL